MVITHNHSDINARVERSTFFREQFVIDFLLTIVMVGSWP